MQGEGAHIVSLVERPAPEITFTDLILGSLGVVAVMTLVAVALGAGLGWLFIIRSRRHGIEHEHPPSIHPFNPQT